MMKFILNVLGSRLGPWIVVGVFSVWLSSLGLVYYKGSTDGRLQCEASKTKTELSKMHTVLQELSQHQEDLLAFQEEQMVQNHQLAETLENKIHNKETIIKEKLREVPIEVAADCSIDYNAVRVHNIIADPTGSN